jgi:hypothetical protein
MKHWKRATVPLCFYLFRVVGLHGAGCSATTAVAKGAEKEDRSVARLKGPASSLGNDRYLRPHFLNIFLVCNGIGIIRD